jgi:hypothetical protein
MALNFPNNPTVGQEYTAQGVTFVWTGALWEVLGPTNFAYATQAEATAGTQQDRAMSPLRTEQAIAARNFQPSEGYGAPVNVAAQRAEGLNYRNTSVRNRFWAVEITNDISCVMRIGPTGTLGNFTTARLLTSAGRNFACGLLIVPPDWVYRLTGVGATFARWWEW